MPPVAMLPHRSTPPAQVGDPTITPRKAAHGHPCLSGASTAPYLQPLVWNRRTTRCLMLQCSLTGPPLPAQGINPTKSLRMAAQGRLCLSGPQYIHVFNS